MDVPGLQFLTFLRLLSVSEVEIKTMDGFLSMLSFYSRLEGIGPGCKACIYITSHLFSIYPICRVSTKADRRLEGTPHNRSGQSPRLLLASS
jgi:hypothetical protein